MLRFVLAAAALAVAATAADAQLVRRGQPQSCPDGKCPLPAAPLAGPGQAPQLAPPTCPGGVCPFAGPGLASPAGVYASPGPAPGPDHELWLEGGRLTWKLKAGRPAPRAMPAAHDVPAAVVEMHRDSLARSAGPPAAGAEPRMHCREFYRVVRSRAEAELPDRLVGEKGYAAAAARAKARELVASLDDRTIDECGARAAGITEGVGGGPGAGGPGPLQRLVDWIIANPDKIAKLVRTVISLLVLFA